MYRSNHKSYELKLRVNIEIGTREKPQTKRSLRPKNETHFAPDEFSFSLQRQCFVR